jgi:hypothetical protein
MPHELQEKRISGICKLIVPGGFDPRHPTAAPIARRNFLARTTGLGAMRRYLNISRPSQLWSGAIAERGTEA